MKLRSAAGMFVAGWVFIFVLFESTSIVAAYYGVGREQVVLHWAMLFAFTVGMVTFHLALYRPMKKNLDASDDLIKQLLKRIKRDDSPNKGDADWWKHN